jgi:phage tail sheath gpL-like
MAVTVVQITHSEAASTVNGRIRTSGGRAVAHSLAKWLEGLAGGVYQGSLDLQVAEGDAVAASGTITFSDTGAADDTVLINGVTFTAKASGATGNQWNVGADEIESAENLAAAINASATALISDNVTASDDGAGVVTVTAAKKGTLGNCITLAEGVDAGNDMAVSGSGRLTGGAEATANSFSFGA